MGLVRCETLTARSSERSTNFPIWKQLDGGAWMVNIIENAGSKCKCIKLMDGQRTHI